MIPSGRWRLRSSKFFWAWIPWNIFLTQGGFTTFPNPEKGPPSSLELRIGSSDCKTGTLFHTKTAVTDQEREVGLSGRKNPLNKNEAMGFIFSPPQPVRFWMKNTWIPLTILFFNEAGKLLSIQEMPVEANPNQPTHFYSEYTPTSLVLEVGPGNSKKFKPQESFLCVLKPSPRSESITPEKANLKFQNLRKTVR
jgi:uncharacterized membrane protein (UPF0127 family)